MCPLFEGVCKCGATKKGSVMSSATQLAILPSSCCSLYVPKGGVCYMSVQDITTMPTYLRGAEWVRNAVLLNQTSSNSIAVVSWPCPSGDGRVAAARILKKRCQPGPGGNVCTESHQCDDPGYVPMNCVDRATAPLVAQAPLRLQLLLQGSLGEDGIPRQPADPPRTVADGSEVNGGDAALVAAN
jgi:hypothetical protein